MAPNNSSVEWTPPEIGPDAKLHYELCIYLLLAVIASLIIVFSFKMSYLGKPRLTRDALLQLIIILLAPAAIAIPDHPLRGAVQAIASIAKATDCWMCTLLNSPTGPGIEFVPLGLNDWWNKSDIFRWGPEWSGGKPHTNSGGEPKQWQRTMWGQPLEYVMGSSKAMYPICFESRGNAEAQMGSLGDHQCTHLVSFNRKLGIWDVHSQQEKGLQLNCWGNVINASLGHKVLFGVKDAAIVPLKFNEYPESQAWYNKSLFILPHTGYIYDPTLVNSNTLLSNQCAKDNLFKPDQILQDLLVTLYCSITSDHYCVPYHAPRLDPNEGWYKGPFSPILSKEPGLFFICGEKAYKYLPTNWTGRCSLGHIVPGGLTVYPHITAPGITNLGSFLHRSKRKFTRNPLIERPTGFHRFTRALFPWLGVAELERALVNISGQLEIALNHTADALNLLNNQLQSVARFALQNRIALDAILAQQGGVCAVINQSCCFYVNHSGQIEQDVSAIKDAVQVLHATAETGKTSWLEWLVQQLGFSLSPFLHSIVTTILIVLIIVVVFCITLCIVRRLINIAISSMQIRYMELTRDPSQFRDSPHTDRIIGHF
ncbi:endogenous retroviral envelope protein HEMO-like [Carettochelys insculpta]|uniref:endogenous retroviral envelope protein HEMO-like n=1 Tax=Carettochelys insculpta TaxID=44489 RepID=UPI003EB7FBB6